jgi:hypothetical protein
MSFEAEGEVRVGGGGRGRGGTYRDGNELVSREAQRQDTQTRGRR